MIYEGDALNVTLDSFLSIINVDYFYKIAYFLRQMDSIVQDAHQIPN